MVVEDIIPTWLTSIVHSLQSPRVTTAPKILDNVRASDLCSNLKTLGCNPSCCLDNSVVVASEQTIHRTTDRNVRTKYRLVDLEFLSLGLY
jgi:hypothetical protein